MIYKSKFEALAQRRKIRDLVEDIVRSNCPLKSPVRIAPPMPRQLAAAKRATFVMRLRQLRRMKDVKLAAKRKQANRRAEWQYYRDVLIAYLQSYITSERTILLLDDRPTKNMRVSGHLKEMI